MWAAATRAPSRKTNGLRFRSNLIPQSSHAGTEQDSRTIDQDVQTAKALLGGRHNPLDILFDSQTSETAVYPDSKILSWTRYLRTASWFRV